MRIIATGILENEHVAFVIKNFVQVDLILESQTSNKKKYCVFVTHSRYEW